MASASVVTSSSTHTTTVSDKPKKDAGAVLGDGWIEDSVLAEMLRVTLEASHQTDRKFDLIPADLRLRVTYPVKWTIVVHWLSAPGKEDEEDKAKYGPAPETDSGLMMFAEARHSIHKPKTDKSLVFMVPVGVRCDGDSDPAKETNHWAALIIDGRKKVITYWDPMGSGFSHEPLRKALIKSFRPFDFTVSSRRAKCQSDQISCGVWTAMFLSAYYQQAKAGPGFSFTDASRVPYNLVPSKPGQPIDTRQRSENERFVKQCREDFRNEIRRWAALTPD